MVDAVVLAGRRNTGELRTVSPAEWEALIEVAGTPMTGWVIRALQGVPGVSRVVVVGPEGLRPFLRGEDRLVAPGETMLDNAARGARATDPGHPVLFVTGDVAMLTASAVSEFLDHAREVAAEIWYPIVRKAAVEARFPGNKRTYVRLRDGTFTGGNILLLAPDTWERAVGRAEALIALRKKPLRLAAMIGTYFVLKWVLGRATVADAERRFSALLGMAARAVVSSHPEVGVDIDHPSDIPYSERELARRQGGVG